MKAPLFSHEVVAGDVPKEGRRYRIEADEEERRRLAESLGIVEILALVAELEVRPLRGRSFSVRGELDAVVVQTDVVNLDPVTQKLREAIDVTLVPAEAGRARSRQREILVDAVEPDGPDVYRNGRIDLGVIAGEHLALGLDPYPRAPGSGFAGHIEDDPGSDPSPFAVLAKLRGGGA